MIQIADTITLDASGLKLTNDGYLIGDAKVSRAGNVQQYAGYEIGITGADANKMFGVYRDPDTVFDTDAMLSLAGRPVTRGHPPFGVNAENWKDLAIGQVGGVIRRDGEHVVAPMAIMDAASAAEVSAGARSLSAGYTVGIVADEGVSPAGEAYQFRQVGPLRFNHVAYLPDNNPRAGNTRMGDSAGQWGKAPITMSDKKEADMADALTTVVLGDKAVQVASTDAAVIEKFKVDAAKALADAQTAHAAAIAAKDTEIGALKADLKAAQDAAKVDIDALVKARADLVAKVHAVDASIVIDGKSDAELRKAAVAAKFGDEMVADASDAEIAGMFKAATKDAAPVDPVRQIIAGGVQTPANDAKAYADAQSAYVARLTRKAS